MFVETILLTALFVTFCAMLLVGFHISYTLFGVSILFTLVAMISDQYFDTATGLDFYYFGIVVKRIYAVMTNWILIAGTLFIFMGFMLEKSGIAERLLTSGNVRGGMAITVALIGTLLAASTGIVGASVVLLGVLSLPIMIKQGYSKELATGTVAASGCLGIIIPPSIMLVFMADQLNLPAGDLFMGAFIPGLMLAALYVIYILGFSFLRPESAPLAEDRQPVGFKTLFRVLLDAVPILALMFLVLGSIIAGIATVTEASGVGALSAMILAAFYRKLNLSMLKEALYGTFNTMGYIFCIIIGATVFAFVVRALGGDEIIEEALTSLPFSDNGIILFVIFCVFLLGFFLDWIEITFIVLPLLVPGFSNKRLWCGRQTSARLVYDLSCSNTSNVFFNATCRICPLLYEGYQPPWCGNERHLQRHNSFCNSSAHSYLFSFSMAGSGHLATGVCLRLILYEWGC